MHNNPQQQAHNAKRGVFSRSSRTALVKVVRGDEAANEGVSDCVTCTVCGGDAAPGDGGLCVACRGLAATFAAASAKESSDA